MLAVTTSGSELLRAGSDNLGPILIWVAILLLPAAGRILRAVLSRGNTPGAPPKPRGSSLARSFEALRRQMEEAMDQGGAAQRSAGEQRPSAAPARRPAPSASPRPSAPAPGAAPPPLPPDLDQTAPMPSVFAGEGELAPETPLGSALSEPSDPATQPLGAAFRGLNRRGPAELSGSASRDAARPSGRRRWRQALVQAELLAPPVALRSQDAPQTPRGFA